MRLSLSSNRWNNIRVSPKSYNILITAIKISYAHIIYILNFRALKQLCYFPENPEGTEVTWCCHRLLILHKLSLAGHLTWQTMLGRQHIPSLNTDEILHCFPLCIFHYWGKANVIFICGLDTMDTDAQPFRYAFPSKTYKQVMFTLPNFAFGDTPPWPTQVQEPGYRLACEQVGTELYTVDSSALCSQPKRAEGMARKDGRVCADMPVKVHLLLRRKRWEIKDGAGDFFRVGAWVCNWCPHPKDWAQRWKQWKKDHGSLGCQLSCLGGGCSHQAQGGKRCFLCVWVSSQA